MPKHAYVYLYRNHVLALRCDQIVKPYSEAWFGGIWTREGSVILPPAPVPSSTYSNHFRLVRTVTDRADAIFDLELEQSLVA